MLSICSEEKHSFKVPVFQKAPSFLMDITVLVVIYMTHGTFLPTLIFTFTASLQGNPKEVTGQFPQVTFQLQGFEQI